MEILLTIAYIVLGILLFSLAIAIHEFGHFIAALKLGLKVERFSIGFGPAIWKKTVNGVEYRISWIPLGGYVAIPDVDPEGTKALEGGSDGEPRAKIPAWKELVVAVAGPAMNVVLAVALACVLALIPSAKFGQLGTEIGGFDRKSPAKAAGMLAGDVVKSVAGRPVSTWSEMMTEIQITNGKPTEFVVARPRNPVTTATCCITPDVMAETNLFSTAVVGLWPEGSAAAAGLAVGDVVVSVDGRRVWSDYDLVSAISEVPTNAPCQVVVRRAGADVALALPVFDAKKESKRNPGVWLTGSFVGAFTATNEYAAVVGHVPSESPAAVSGLSAGDRIVSVGGVRVFTWSDVQTALKAAGGEAEVLVERRTPESERIYDDVTLTFAPLGSEDSRAFFIHAHSIPNPTGSVAWMPARNPLRQLAWDAGGIFRILKALVTPKEAKATGKALGGPVLIAESIYKSLRHDITDGLGFLRFLNTNLAIMNLLPIPVLDGGLIVFALIAIVFRRRVPEKIVGALTTGFMYILLALMAFLICNDAWWSWKRHSAEDPADSIEVLVPEGGGYAV